MAARREIETEVKLDVPDDVDVPDLADVPGVGRVDREQRDLEAVYLDTHDHRLTRAGFSLRRRTGGPDEGWHLKGPREGASRTETRLPLSPLADGIPPELAALVADVVDGTAVGPVATVRTRRHVHLLADADGAPLAEVCDDRVTAVRHGTAGGDGLAWREWEVELAGRGDTDLLDAVVAVLCDAGAVPAASGSKAARVLEPGGDDAAPTVSAAEVVGGYLAAQVAVIVDLHDAVRADAPDAVHRMRVAIRRLRSTLRTARPLLDRERTEPLRAALAGLAEALGEARDAEVVRERVLRLVDAQPTALVVGPVRERAEAELGDLLTERHAEAVRALDGDAVVRLVADLQELTEHPPWRDGAAEPAADVLPRRVAWAYRRLAAAVADVVVLPPGTARDVALHECRKAAKRTRYAAEVAVDVVGEPAEELVEALVAVQDALGEHQDAVTVRAVLLDLAMTAHAAGENAFTWGRLHEQEEAAGRAAHAAFEEAWAAASRRRLLRWLPV